MELLADEDIDRPIVEMLREEGFDIFYVDEEMKGATDTQVLEKARETGRVILTFDSDFANPGKKHAGIIRLTRLDRYAVVVNAVKQLISSLENQDLDNTVIQLSPQDYSDNR